MGRVAIVDLRKKPTLKRAKFPILTPPGAELTRVSKCALWRVAKHFPVGRVKSSDPQPRASGFAYSYLRFGLPCDSTPRRVHDNVLVGWSSLPNNVGSSFWIPAPQKLASQSYASNCGATGSDNFFLWRREADGPVITGDMRSKVRQPLNGLPKGLAAARLVAGSRPRRSSHRRAFRK
jgi:hypothetical protein